VPIHVLSREPDLVEPFRRVGWTPGLIPERTVASMGMESFLGRFLDAFSGAARADAQPSNTTAR
jgi:hypothetical protein